MQFTATASVEEVAAALGLRPVAVRQRIKAGTLSAVRIGRAWRVHTDSVNALLGKPQPTAATPTPPASAPQSTSVPPPEHRPTKLRPGSPEWVQWHMDIFDASDAPWIEKYTWELGSSDPQVASNAQYQLSMFKASRERMLKQLNGQLVPKPETPQQSLFQPGPHWF
jgi:excisionase family DNA binding protein